ncbi:putative ABC transporter permease [Eubacteriales bacterium OttesenSCG-928-A19]|nr:putative ABC transporter permease [Eubacteriales bacterium OttesenSCG-928-A19]
MHSISQYVAMFFVYGLLGWAALSVVRSVAAGRLVSAGFFTGPVCPVFGAGGVILVLLSPMVSAWPPLTFITATLLALVLDLVTAWMMQGLFRLRWWTDKSTGVRAAAKRLLRAAIAGLLGTLLVFVIHPYVADLISRVSVSLLRFLTAIFVGALFLDLLYSLDILDKLMLRVQALQAELEKFEALYAHQDPRDLSELKNDVEWLRSLREAGRLDEQETLALARVDELTALWRPGYRLILGLPHMRPIGLDAPYAILRKEWMSHGERTMSRFQRWMTRVRNSLTSTARALNPFTAGTGFYKLVWVFAIACVLGYLIETAFCLVMRGIIESRQGMVYGPFNQVYGLGAVLMVLLLHPLAKKSDRWLFVGGALLGGAFEFACSWVQEKVFGTVSWEYSGDMFSIGGRTNLQLMLCWGVLGVVFMKGIYPRLSALIDRIPRRPGLFLTWVLAIGLGLNMLLSAAAVGRWVTRQHGAPAEGAVATYLDRHFPNDVMEEIYPSMQIVSDPAIRVAP